MKRRKLEKLLKAHERAEDINEALGIILTFAGFMISMTYPEVTLVDFFETNTMQLTIILMLVGLGLLLSSLVKSAFVVITLNSKEYNLDVEFDNTIDKDNFPTYHGAEQNEYKD